MSAALVAAIMFDRSVLSCDDGAAIRSALEALLTECQGNVTLASRQAGIERQSMHRLLNRYRLQARDYRPKGGGSIIARAALKNLAAAAPSIAPAPSVRVYVREVDTRFDQSDVPVRRGAAHHRPAHYQSDLGHAALHALTGRKIA
jgi:hypothetical protein